MAVISPNIPTPSALSLGTILVMAASLAGGLLFLFVIPAAYLGGILVFILGFLFIASGLTLLMVKLFSKRRRNRV